IWRLHLAGKVPVDPDLDFAFLASQFPVSGGSIRNVVVEGAFLAAEQGGAKGPVTIDHIIEALRHEYQKQGKLVMKTDLGRYARVHRNEQAADLALREGADALTVGRDIYFAAGAYGPATLAHEVSHVLQQSDATSHVQSEDPTLEHEAIRASADVVSGQIASVS